MDGWLSMEDMTLTIHRQDPPWAGSNRDWPIEAITRARLTAISVQGLVTQFLITRVIMVWEWQAGSMTRSWHHCNCKKRLTSQQASGNTCWESCCGRAWRNKEGNPLCFSPLTNWNDGFPASSPLGWLFRGLLHESCHKAWSGNLISLVASFSASFVKPAGSEDDFFFCSFSPEESVASKTSWEIAFDLAIKLLTSFGFA